MGRCVGRPVAAVVSSAEERSFLERRVRRRRVARGMSDRRRIVLRCADGLTSKAVAAELGAHDRAVGKWRRRFPKDRVEGLSDAPRSGRPRSMENARADARDAPRRRASVDPLDGPGGGAFAGPTPSRTGAAIGRRTFRIASFPERANARKASGVCIVRAALIAAGIATSQPYPQPQYVVA